MCVLCVCVCVYEDREREGERMQSKSNFKICAFKTQSHYFEQLNNIKKVFELDFNLSTIAGSYFFLHSNSRTSIICNIYLTLMVNVLAISYILLSKYFSDLESKCHIAFPFVPLFMHRRSLCIHWQSTNMCFGC